MVERCTAGTNYVGTIRLSYWDFSTTALSTSTILVNAGSGSCSTWTVLT
jgi:hypothetical protein